MSAWLRQLPNSISAFRIALVPPIGIALAHRDWPTAIALILIATASDGVDGFLAKRFGWQTTLGALLDPAADKLLVATVFVMLALQGGVPLWLMAVAVGRDLVIVAGALAYRWRFGPLHVRPSVASKLNTLCQLSFVLSVVVRREFGWPPAWTGTALGAATLVTTTVSGIDYVLTTGRAAREAVRAEAVG
ncbi:MAG: CDP-alcohol phosphatidyltransferase family protein [Gammaproteobacteria bacterium]|nr:CDP-alcohol phosphatidyltransferase family protein [Gammaproteobacteria bacterium]